MINDQLMSYWLIIKNKYIIIFDLINIKCIIIIYLNQ